MRGCVLKSEKHLRKDGGGSYDGAVEKNSMIRIVRWLDNRAVQLASNYAHTEPLHKCKRYSKKEREDLEILQPNIVKLYNSYAPKFVPSSSQKQKVVHDNIFLDPWYICY